MTRWFRFYEDAINDPKVQRLPAELFKTWVNLLCLASKNNGILPSIEDIAFAIRVDHETLMKQISLLVDAELLDSSPSLHPHNWNKRQFKSDTSSDRVRNFRKKKTMKRTGNVSETRSESESESDTDSETEQKQTRAASPPRVVRGKKSGKPEPSPETRRVLDFIGELKGTQLDAPGLIPDRLAEGYSVYDCLLVYWRARRRWKAGHNQTSPFRPAHFGVLLDEARADVKLGDQGEGGKDFGFVKTWEFFKHKGLEGDALTMALLKNGYTHDGRSAPLAHFADFGKFPEESAEAREA